LEDDRPVDSFDDLFEPFELEDGPPPPGTKPPAPRKEAAPKKDAVPTVACPSCGTVNQAYNRHCEACGARLGKSPLPVAPPPMVRATPGGRALGVLAAVVLVVALAALLFNVFGGGGEETAATSTTITTTTQAVFVQELQPTSAEANSELSPSFGAANLIDADPATEWQDQGLRGIGAALTFRFSQPVEITEIEIVNIPDEDRYKQNYRIKGYKITVDDLSYDISGQLTDINTPQTVDVASISTRVLTIEVTSTYKAEGVGDNPPFTELVLADVRFFGRLSQ